MHYHFDAGAVKPYVGGGLTYVLAFESRDAALGRLDVKNALGGALQAGIDWQASRDWAIFIDLKKLIVDAKATFDTPAPGKATAKLDPLIVHAGVMFRF
jgi:outer membrane protein